MTAPKKNPHDIKNKLKRQEVYRRLKSAKAADKKQRRKDRAIELEQLGQDARRPKPKTLETKRVEDETMVHAEDEEILTEKSLDEFASYFLGTSEPKLAITTCRKPTSRMFDFIRELLDTIPNAHFYERRGVNLKDIIEQAKTTDFTDIMVLNEDRKDISKIQGLRVINALADGMLLIHLPGGPTAHFRITSLKLNAEIPHHGVLTDHKPELILNNFKTRLGHRIARMFAALFPKKPDFLGRRVVTLHNQRDFVFFRQHRYIFEQGEKDTKAIKTPGGQIARLQELGPQFTLKLKSLQHGTFDSTGGEFEWKSDVSFVSGVFSSNLLSADGRSKMSNQVLLVI
jgi:ribosome production factor 1